MRCCGCPGGTAYEQQKDQESILDLGLLEANERSLKFGFRAPRKSSRLPSSSTGSVRIGRGPLDFIVSVIGGPYSDIVGAREERIASIACGSSVVHEVTNLQPETEYTIQVSMVAHGEQQRLLEETLDARTADATTALFAGEDWGRSNAKGSKDGNCVKDPKSSETDAKGSGGTSSSWMRSPGAASSAAPASSAAAAPARTDSQDDVSTNAPSEAGEDTARNFNDNASESGSEPASPRPTTAPDGEAAGRQQAQDHSGSLLDDLHGNTGLQAVNDVNVVELDPAPKRTFECKFFDCFKLGFRNQRPATSQSEIVIERGNEATRAAPKAAPKRRPFKPYRPPFPGIPVDPASVGLLPRVELEVA